MERKVLVTGASGFVGRYLIHELMERNYEVVALVHKSCAKLDGVLTTIKADISNEQVLQILDRENCKNIDIIIHLAANLDMHGSDEVIDVNCQGTYHMIKFANQVHAKHFIYLSSIPIIGVPKETPITEEHPVNPRTLYHITKYAGEQMVRELCESAMLRTIFRIPSPIGVGMRTDNFLTNLLEKCLKNETIELFGKGTRIQNYIDVRDIGIPIIQSIYLAKTGLFLLAGKEEISNRNLASLCRNITKTKSDIIFGKRKDPEENNKWIISIEKAKNELGFMPRYSLEETIGWIYDSMKRR